jgi:hypothetical protein
MKKIALLLSLFCLNSCVHTAITPLANPSGSPVVIKVPNTSINKLPRKSQLIAINENMSEASHNRQALQRYFPGIEPSEIRTQWDAIGITGTTKTKKGQAFVFYLPLVILKSNQSDEVSDKAVVLLAKDFYREAKKHYEVIPISDLEKKPKRTTSP